MPSELEISTRPPQFPRVHRSQRAARIAPTTTRTRRTRRFAQVTRQGQRTRASSFDGDQLPDPEFSSSHLRRFIQEWHRFRAQEVAAEHLACYLSGVLETPTPEPHANFQCFPALISVWRESREARLEDVLRSERYGSMDRWIPHMYYPRTSGATWRDEESDDYLDDYSDDDSDDDE